MDAIDRYGTPEHEAWLIDLETHPESFPGDVPAPADVGGCGCVVSQIYGGDCAHTVELGE